MQTIGEDHTSTVEGAQTRFVCGDTVRTKDSHYIKDMKPSRRLPYSRHNGRLKLFSSLLEFSALTVRIIAVSGQLFDIFTVPILSASLRSTSQVFGKADLILQGQSNKCQTNLRQ